MADFYVTAFRVQVQTQLQYRAATYMYTLGMVAEPTIYLVVWSTIARSHGGTINGLTPHAFNTGLRESTGDYVCILGSHASYDRDYVRVCLEELERTGATGCSGRVILEPAGDSLAAQLSAWTLGSPFASSGRSFRTAPQGFADTIPYPVFRRQPLVELGGYNERLLVAEDVAFLWALKRLGRSRRQRLTRLRSMKAVASTRKFDRHGDWHYFRDFTRMAFGRVRNPNATDEFIQRYWYNDRP